MRYLTFIAVYMIGCASLFCEDDNRKNIELSIPGNQKVNFAYADGFVVQKIQPSPELPPTLKVRSPNGKMSLQVTIMPHGDIDISTQEAVNKMTRNLGKTQHESGSVEKTTKIKEIKAKAGLCAFAQYSDADLAGVENPRPGQFKVVGTGVLVIGDSIAAITLLGNGFDDADYQAGLALVTDGLTQK